MLIEHMQLQEDLLVSVVEEPAVDLAVGGVEGAVLHQEAHLDQGCRPWDT